ncbi:MAG: dCTP deaminase [Armatimonadetes bacterium]|nr:dCTP deaminase [Armatimonadota bacterium]
MTSVLGGIEIKQRMREAFPSKLVITPILNGDQQIPDHAAAVDLRLGPQFIVAKRSHFAQIDARDADSLTPVYQSQEHFDVGMEGEIVIHPQQFLLAATLEYLRIPMDLTGSVIGRSSWGRIGLIIATATAVHPGFTGCLTLELQNLGDTPIVLHPGTRIAQIAFYRVGADPASFTSRVYRAKYVAAIGPEFSRLGNDADWKMINQLKR